MRRRLRSALFSLQFKILAGVTALTVLFGGVVMGNVHTGLSRTLKEELARRGATIARSVTGQAEDFVLTQNYFALHRLLREVATDYDDVRYVFVADAKGDIRAHTFNGHFPAALLRSLAPRRTGAGLRRRLILTEDGLVLDVAFSLLDGRLGEVHVGMKEYAVRRRIARMVALWGVFAVFVLGSGLAVAYVLTARLSRRLARMNSITRRVGAGDLEARVEDGGRDEVGELAGAFNSMIHDLRQSRDQLVRSGKLAAVGELASCVAHEINNPLNTMAVCTSALRERSENQELRACGEFAAFPEYLGTINDEILRCRRITSELLDFARRREPRREEQDLNKLARLTIPLAVHRAKEVGTRIEFSPSRSSAAVEADGDQIKQVLLNMLLNALDHLPSGGGGVKVAVLQRKGEAGIRVQDTGRGIPPENLRKIFEPFFTTKPPGRGTGLGLAICQRIMDDHHGRIEVSSEVGRGSTFTLILPSMQSRRGAET
jgi:signal transduction histidine kinase